MEEPETDRFDILAVGHICLDIIPTFGPNAGDWSSLIVPGKLIDVGPPVLATGGSVSNTGLALHRLGGRTRLMGKTGDDLFGGAVRQVLNRYDSSLSEGMMSAAGEQTSYTVVINPPGVDRVFLHCPGANDTFCADEVPLAFARKAGIVHFGYPPLMRAVYADGGKRLADLFAALQESGVTTSLDMARPDPHSEAGRVHWRDWLRVVLPYVDVFAPSLDEILFMLNRPRFESLMEKAGGGSFASVIEVGLLSDLAGELLDMGARIVALKLGEAGLYLRTTADPSV